MKHRVYADVVNKIIVTWRCRVQFVGSSETGAISVASKDGYEILLPWHVCDNFQLLKALDVDWLELYNSDVRSKNTHYL
jgi:hypothetical protein